MAKAPTKAQFVADHLAVRIAAGDYLPGQWLPGGKTIGDELGVDRGTVRNALLMLAERGLVEVVEGNGAKVAARVASSNYEPADLTRGVGRWRGFGATVIRDGGEPYAEVARVVEVEVPASVANRLGVPLGTTVLLRDRVQGRIAADGTREPVQIALTWITMEVVGRAPVVREEDTGPGGITSRITEAGYDMRYEDVVTARLADTFEQARLGIDDRQAVLDVWRRTFDQDGRVIKVSNRIVNPLRQGLTSAY